MWGVLIFISIPHYANDWLGDLEFALACMYKSENSPHFGIPQWYQELHYSYQYFCFYSFFSKTISNN